MNLPDLTLETIQAILDGSLDDDTINHLVLRSLGFRYDASRQVWDSTQAEPNWQTGRIPDFMNHRPDIVKLTRTIPSADKQLLKEMLNFSGYLIQELTPQKTRRATVANWLLGILKQSQD